MTDIMKNNTHKQNNIQEGDPKSKASFHPGSTIQGGSNFGQGSNDLGKHSYRQGSEKNEGANYGNERGWNNEALRRNEEKVVPKRHK
jgi:hypothetical protein